MTSSTDTRSITGKRRILPSWLMPILTTTAMSLGGWSLGWCMGTETRVTRLEEWRKSRSVQDAAVIEALNEIKRDLKDHIRYHMTERGPR